MKKLTKQPEEGAEETEADSLSSKAVETERKSNKKDNKQENKQVSSLRKKMKDTRFWKKEQAINEAFFGSSGEISATELAKKAGVARVTLYRHHRGVHRVTPDVEERTLEDYEEEIVIKGMKPGIKVRLLYLRTLSFIRSRKMEFEGMIEQGDERVLGEMVGKIVPKISQVYKIPKNFTEGIRVYENEVMAVVEVWIEDDFSTSEIRVLNNIMFLTRTARKRLMALEK